MTESSPSPPPPSIEFLRAAAAQQGVFVEDGTSRASLGFLSVLLPRLADIEERLPPETPVWASPRSRVAFGAMTMQPALGAAHNPWALDRICGGSSGGSGAAAAADLAAGTLGTDTAGSIRIPSCFCGVTGLRPTTGLVPTDGVVPVAWSLDTVGPIARSAKDCALLLAALTEEPFELVEGIRGLRIGVIDELFRRAGPAVAAQVHAAVDELRGLGATVESVEVPLLEESGTITQLLMLPEATEVHLPWLRSQLDDYGADVRARLSPASCCRPRRT